MKKLKLVVMAIFAFFIAACAQNTSTTNKEQTDMKDKALVVYFSATGTTRKAAEKIADNLNADILEIEPEDYYTDADLDWNDRQSRSSVEMTSDNSRPAIKPDSVDMTKYDVVFIGYPIWWDLAPRVVNTFIETHSLKDAKVYPFATSGGSSINNSVKDLKKLYPEIKWENGKLLNNTSDSDIDNWLKAIIK